MRNPYITGPWVRGPDHYGRHALIRHLLESPNDAFWVIGNRRMGKSSLLRQLEFLALQGMDYVPLLIDLQGTASLEALTAEILFAVDEEEQRFRQLMVDRNLLNTFDAVDILRLMRRYARAAGKTLLLLLDEAEALINLGTADPLGLARLRKVLQSDQGLRVVMTSTKILSLVDEQQHDLHTSPFLFGFSMANLTGLEEEATAGLIRHGQGLEQVEVDEAQVQEISGHTNNHPYLTQVLCSRLFQDNGTLRPIAPEDLTPDTILRSYFKNDYRWLAAGERQVLLSVAQGHQNGEAIASATSLSRQEVQAFVFSLQRLGQLRLGPQGLAVGNTFLRNWIEANLPRLLEESRSSEVSDETTRKLILEAQQQEAQYLLRQLTILRGNLGELELQRANFVLNPPLDLINAIKKVKIEIQQAEQRLELIPSDIVRNYQVSVPVIAA